MNGSGFADVVVSLSEIISITLVPQEEIPTPDHQIFIDFLFCRCGGRFIDLIDHLFADI